ncbi:hypothetical protein QBC45DRAFT_339769, partial [Copromyces sp. CBS 386.78]
QDPKYLFNFILSYINRITNKVRNEIFAEFLLIKRASFDLIYTFLYRYTILRKRIITDIKFNIDNDLKINLLYNAIKVYYPVDIKI